MSSSQPQESSGRLTLLDAIRGFSVLSMVGFHYCYDLKFLAGVSLDWFAPPLQDIWRASISWTFLLLAGFMCALSRNNLKRAAEYGAVALAIFVVTSIIAVDVPISFGIIYCMAACTLFAAILQRANLIPHGPVATIVLFAAFLVVRDLPLGFIGIGSWRIALPHWLYQIHGLSWLGIPGPGFASGDYYPLLPYLLLYLSGCSLGMWGKQCGFPTALSTLRCRPLELVGRHSLLIYVLHQPLLLLITLL